MIEWISNNWLEVFGTATGLLYIFLSIKEKIYLWPVGLITSTVYIYIFFTSKFYADMGLQFYYVFVSIYGWFYWVKGSKKEKSHQKEELKVKKTPLKTGLILIPVTMVIFIFLGWFLKNYTDSPVPYWDALTTSASIVATWMLARKYLEQWLVWVAVDLISTGLYFVKGLYPTVVLFIVYTIMAVVGYFQWRKNFYAEQQA